MNATDLFDTDRLTLGWTESEVQLGHLAAKAFAEDRVLQLTSAITALNTNIQKLVVRDPSEQLRQLKAYKDTDDRLIEEAVTYAVADRVGGTVVLATRYEYQGEGGDLDGLVVGSWQGQDVVVLVEAKHNMDSSFTKAKKELFASQKYWESLSTRGFDELEDAEKADWEAMHVGEYGARKVVLAWGGSKFSEDTVKKHFKICMPWFQVVPDMKGKFAASYVGGYAVAASNAVLAQQLVASSNQHATSPPHNMASHWFWGTAMQGYSEFLHDIQGESTKTHIAHAFQWPTFIKHNIMRMCYVGKLGKKD